MGPANPAQGRLRGATNKALIVGSVHQDSTHAGDLGLLHLPFGEEGSPLTERVDRPIETVSVLFEAFSSYNADRTTTVEKLPTLHEVMERGLGGYLEPPRE